MLLYLPVTNSRIVRARQYDCENNELVELWIPVETTCSSAFDGNPMPRAIQIRQTLAGPTLNRTPIEVGDVGSNQVRLRQVAGARKLGLHHPGQVTRDPRSLL